jgi:uroporphyrinogen III methyltransferase/synthase
MQRLAALGFDARQLGGVRLAAIGPATTDALARFHLVADVQPATYRAEALADELAGDAKNRRFLLVRGRRGREVLAETLAAVGGHIVQIVVYESRDVKEVDSGIAATLAGGRVDWTTVTSSAIARSLVNLFGKSLRKTRLAAISPLTAETLQELGFKPAAVADEYTAAGLVEAILRAES